MIDPNNRLKTDGTYNYTYDAEGNRTRKTKISDGSYVDYTWDHRNRLTAVAFKTSSGTLTKQVTYGYDTFDRRVKKSVDDDGNGTIDRTERYVYDFTNKTDGTTDVSLDDVVLTFDGSGALTHRYLHGADIDELFADETATGAVLWALDDEQGTIRDWAEYNSGTNTTTVTDHLKYDSFGRITSQSNSSHTVVYAFTGREWDKDVDLQYNRMRWYDPVVGRWISEDPIGFAGGDANLVRYVGNNPVNYEDPSGLWAESSGKEERVVFPQPPGPPGAPPPNDWTQWGPKEWPQLPPPERPSPLGPGGPVPEDWTNWGPHFPPPLPPIGPLPPNPSNPTPGPNPGPNGNGNGPGGNGTGGNGTGGWSPGDPNNGDDDSSVGTALLRRLRLDEQPDTDPESPIGDDFRPHDPGNNNSSFNPGERPAFYRFFSMDFMASGTNQEQQFQFRLNLYADPKSNWGVWGQIGGTTDILNNSKITKPYFMLGIDWSY